VRIVASAAGGDAGDAAEVAEPLHALRHGGGDLVLIVAADVAVLAGLEAAGLELVDQALGVGGAAQTRVVELLLEVRLAHGLAARGGSDRSQPDESGQDEETETTHWGPLLWVLGQTDRHRAGLRAACRSASRHARRVAR